MDIDVSIDKMLAFLTRDGGKVPCSRYGYDTESCAPWAVALQLIFWDANGSGDAPLSESLDQLMGLVVNDHDDVLNLVADSAHVLEDTDLAYVLEDAAELLRDDITRQLAGLSTHTLLRLQALTADPGKCWEYVRDLA